MLWLELGLAIEGSGQVVFVMALVQRRCGSLLSLARLVVSAGNLCGGISAVQMVVISSNDELFILFCLASDKSKKPCSTFRKNTTFLV